jgi:thiol-disulfide isomerase/thioredoxin
VALLGLSLAACEATVPGGRAETPRRPGSEEHAADRARVRLPSIADRVELPGFDGATGWLNVEHAPTREDLEGRVVLVDFWTSCCINCMQTLPALSQIEARFRGRPFTVVGVHAPKFDGEASSLRLESTLEELGIRHPVAVDSDMAIWRAWGVQAWPTLIVLDARGRGVWADTGEPDVDELEAVVESALADGAERGELAKGPPTFVKPGEKHDGVLSFPTEVTSLGGRRIAVSDTGHDRVLVVSADGAVEAVAGSGSPGFDDGDLAHATFRSPHGIAARGDVLYVADTGNHAVRAIDLAKGRVSTVAGTGMLGDHALRPGAANAKETALRSPWDVLATGETLVVALAGSHQLATLDPVKGEIALLAGTGRENIVDGPLLQAAFAQPSALATDGERIFVADSETSSVRAVDRTTGLVKTLVGKGLFDFGDADGDAAHARMQHPLGIAFADGALYVDDTYNEKLRRVDPKTGETTTVKVWGGLHQPAGLAVVDGQLLIADSHASRLVRVPKTGGDATPVAVLNAGPRVEIDPRDPVEKASSPVRASGPTTVTVSLVPPNGTLLNKDAFVKLAWIEERGLRVKAPTEKVKGSDAQHGIPVEVSLETGASDGSLTGVLEAVLCDTGKTACTPIRRTLRLSARADDAHANAATWSIALPSAK